MFNQINLTMKKPFLLAALLIAATFSSCKYDDGDIWSSVHGLEDRVSKLEELCKQMNTNISSLQTLVTALQNNDYVTGVTPVTYNGETVGYTIAFTKSSPITIYHGQNGKDGANGSDGNDGLTPVIGVRQDTDGIYYWTLDGDWLLDAAGKQIKAEGRDGQNGKDGADGTNGSDGRPGTDGKDGITPQLKIENGYWYVSTDGGTTWTNLGKATGEDGKDGADSGDSIFQNITQDDDNIYFALKNGETVILPKRQQLAITFDEGYVLQFDIGETKTVHYTITGGSDRNIVKAEMQNLDGYYTLRTTPTNAFSGTITITGTVPSTDNVIVSVSDGTQTIMVAIAVSVKPITITVETPGTLSSLLADYDKNIITHLTIIGSLNDSDIAALRALPRLTVLDMSDVDLEALPDEAFKQMTSLTSVVLPQSLTSIGNSAFWGCSGLTGNLVIPESVTSIGGSTFSNCSKLTAVYCKATTPPTVESTAFPATLYNRSLYVPVGCKEAYAAADIWKDFATIEETEF